ncbi:hypothetical protein [Aegicerativicinus sediminis]|uniref:hypothetical protein n=1 Tax=Aegicerativicinus sediminis TaxID=2893202 RepID=UPI001E35BA16|nr:hypothetical protein [Aegicerativicinus sediminis]
MKKTYFFIGCFISFIAAFSQEDCSTAQAHIVYAFSNSKTGLDANNVTHVKYYGNKTLDAFERVQKALKSCDCPDVGEWTYQAIEKLKKLDATEKIADAKYFVGKANAYAQDIITALDLYTAGESSVSNEVTQLDSIEEEQLRLQQEQEALKKKQEQLKQKLAEQQQLEQSLAKEQLIVKSETALSNSIKAYNDLLSTCDCKKTVEPKRENKEILKTKSLEEIRKYYISSIKNITSDYIATLDECED